jgi:hypothetical protein
MPLADDDEAAGAADYDDAEVAAMMQAVAAVYARGKAEPARVVRVHVDGAARTQNWLLAAIVRDVLGAGTVGDAVARAQLARQKLEQLHIFKEVTVRLDTAAAAADADPAAAMAAADEYEVVFTVVERRLVTGNAGVKFSNNEGSADSEVRLAGWLSEWMHACCH